MRALVRPRGTESVRRDALDRLAFSDCARRSARFRALAGNVPEQEGEKGGYEGWSALVEDLFASYHMEHEPELVPADEIEPAMRLNRTVMGALLGRAEHLSTRAHTRSRELEAALATMAASETLKEELGDALAQASEKIAQAEAAHRAAEEKAEKRRRQGDSAGAAVADAETTRLRDEMEALIESAEQTLSGQIDRAVDAAGEVAREGATLAARLPGLGPGERRRIPLERQIAYAERWMASEKLRRIARLSGRLVRDMQGARARRVLGGKERPVSVTHGDDLAMLLPDEMVALRVPALRKDALLRLGDRALRVFETDGEERGARGPVIIVVDSSGSMAGAHIEWAKAVCLALVSLAHRERRQAAVVEFSGQVRSWVFPPRKSGSEDLAEMAGHHFGGGTDTALGLREAERLIGEHEPFRQADIILVTDGADRFDKDDEKIRDRLRALGVRIQGIAVERQPTEYLRLMCEVCSSVYELEGPSEGVRDLARRLTPP
jgi:uncharacterized protein with von Willebrand factor type A (vWA) domain